MSKYKVGDKVVFTVSDVKERGYCPYYVFNNNNLTLSKLNTDKYTEPLLTYTLPLEYKISRQAAEITRLLAENKRLKAENEKMGVKLDAYELYGDQHEEEYNQAFNQGAEAAWELARKIAVVPKEGGWSSRELIEIFNTASVSEIFDLTYPEAAAKVAEWEKAKEEIKVGDVLEDIYDSDIKCVATNLYPNNMAYLVFDDGTAGMHKLDTFKKTSRRMPIDSFLKQIEGEQE